MILPVIPYGNHILRKVSSDIPEGTPELSDLINDMWETMYTAKGIGIAAPQVGRNIRLFLVDTEQFFLRNPGSDYSDRPGYKGVFINARVLARFGEPWSYEEGCLSIPEVEGTVWREENVTLAFYDRHFRQHVQTFNGFTARVILHEYDHIEGKLFIDYLSPLKKRLVANKLKLIMKGKVRMNYPIKYNGGGNRSLKRDS